MSISVDTNRTFPNTLFFREVEQLLSKNLKVTLRVKGKSMRPFLREGDTVRLAPIAPGGLKKWDVVLAHTTYGVLLHRVVSIRRDKITLAGDANRRLEQIERKHIIGIVDAAWRGEHPLKIKAFPLLALWHRMRLLRGYLLSLYDRLSLLKETLIIIMYAHEYY